jgi:hypothetical protein
MSDIGSIRASDSERQAIVDALGAHFRDGRLDLNEYDLRIGQAYRATTRAELEPLLRDLPRVQPGPEQAVAKQAWRPTGPVKPIPVWLRIEWTAWLTASLICLAIWGIITVAAGSWTYPWPIWVIGPWGAVLAARTAGARFFGFTPGRRGACSRGNVHKVPASGRKRSWEIPTAYPPRGHHYAGRQHRQQGQFEPEE